MKIYRICLNCGNVEARTDIFENIDNNYKIIRGERCPNCEKNNYMITKNIKKLKLNLNINNNLERNIKYLIG